MEKWSFNIDCKYVDSVKENISEIHKKYFQLIKWRQVCSFYTDDIFCFMFTVNAESLGEAIMIALNDLKELRFPLKPSEIHIDK